MLLVLFFQTIPAAAEQIKNTTSASSDSSPLVFIILPVEDVASMYRNFLPLKNYLEKQLSRKIKLKVAENYQEAIDSIGSGEAHLAYLDPSAYCEAKNRHKIVPLAKAVLKNSSTYKSVIVARQDSPINKIVDAKGKKMAFGNISSSSSYLIPAVMLKEVGLSLEHFESVDFLENEDRIVLSVLAKRHEVGGVSEQVALKYINDGLKIIKTSESIPQFSVIANGRLPGQLLSEIRSALLSISKDATPELLNTLEDISGFAPVVDRDFDVVRVMIRNLTGRNYLEYKTNTIKVAILPLYSPITLFERFDPLMRYLSSKTGREFKLVIPKDFEDFFEIIEKAEADFSYSNPYIYIQLADKGFLTAFANTVLEQSGDIFRGIIIAHKESPVKSINDLRGKRVMVVSFRSAGGFLAQKLFLYENGIDVMKDLHLIEGKKQEEVILNVYAKKIDAGFVRESALKVLEEEIDLSRINILATTPYIANWPFASTRRVDTKMVSLVRKTLLDLNQKDILRAAQVERFKAAEDCDFDSLRVWINKYESR